MTYTCSSIGTLRHQVLYGLFPLPVCCDMQGGISKFVFRVQQCWIDEQDAQCFDIATGSRFVYRTLGTVMSLHKLLFLAY